MGKMSNMKTTVLLALKNLTRQKRRSLMLALAISFGFFIVTAIDGIASGAMKNLVEHIVQMQGGNVIVQGFESMLFKKLQAFDPDIMTLRFEQLQVWRRKNGY